MFLKAGCEPTYEELKHGYALDAASGGGGCEPTYEELKPYTLRKNNKPETELRAYL